MDRRKFLETAAALLAATDLSSPTLAAPLAEPVPLEPITPDQLTAKTGLQPFTHELQPIQLIDAKDSMAVLQFISGSEQWMGLAGSLHLQQYQPIYSYYQDLWDRDPSRRHYLPGRVVCLLSLDTLVMPTEACQAMGMAMANIMQAHQNQIRLTPQLNCLLQRTVLTNIGSCAEANGLSVLRDLQFHAAAVEICGETPANS